MAAVIRQPVVVVLGHVDSGKTSLLDKIRGTAVQAREVGGMTQHIGASFFPIETLQQICGPLLAKLGGEIQVPGLLVIDTPGHEVFTNLRTRGGSAADISILVVDAIRGFEVQTYESIEILRGRKVPFVVALNKIDLIPAWRKGATQFVTSSLNGQDRQVVDELDQRIYAVVGVLSRLGFSSEAFYRVTDFTHQIAIVPVSAKTGEGIPELMSVLVGLTQQYLRGKLAVTLGTPRGIVLEVKEEPGLGHTANVILLDGVLRTADPVALANREGALVTKIRGIFMPKPLDEMRDPRDRFTLVEEVRAAAGLKIAAPELDGVLAGSPLLGIADPSAIDAAKARVESEVRSALIHTDRVGVVVKSDTLGSLEAITEMLRRRDVAVRIADIGPVTHHDIIEAATVRDVDRYHGAVLAFGVKLLPDAEQEAVSRRLKLFTNPVIYSLVQEYVDWVAAEREAVERSEFLALTPPCKFRFLKGYVFRRSNPAIFGVEVLAGRLRQKVKVINVEGKDVGTIHQIQDRGKSLDEAPQGAQVAVSMQEPTVGRQIEEGNTFYTLPEDREVKTLLEKYRKRLTEHEAKALNETMEARRRINPLYAF